MKIHFYIEKKGESEKYQILMIITDPAFSSRVKYYTGEKIKPADWNKKKERAKGGYFGELNAFLDSLEHRSNQIKFKLKSEDKFTKENFINDLVGDKSRKRGFWEYFDNWIEDCKTEESIITDNPLSERTIMIFRSLKNILQDYEKDRKLKLTGAYFGLDFYRDFKKYITEERINQNTKSAGGSVNTFSNHIKNIKKFLLWLSDRDKGVNPEFKSFKKKFVKSDDKPFREEELLKLYDFKWNYSAIKKFYELFPETTRKNNIRIRMETMERARLILLFLCSSGKRISDYNTMTEFEIEGEIIKFKAKKNQVVCYVPNFDDLYFRPKQLLSEMIDKFGSMPQVSGQKLNDTLHDLALVVGLDRFNPTSKTGRKTYATLKVKSGVSPDIIRISTGHKTTEAFYSYVEIDQYDVIKANKEKAQYLKAI